MPSPPRKWWPTSRRPTTSWSIRGGAFAGKALDVNGVKQLANIPSKEVLLAQLCGLLMSPISRTAVVLGALARKKAAAAERPPEAAAAAKRPHVRPT